MAEFIKINVADNVAVAIHDVEAGCSFDIDGVSVTTLAKIPAGHKVALKDIATGEDIVKLSREQILDGGVYLSFGIRGAQTLHIGDARHFFGEGDLALQGGVQRLDTVHGGITAGVRGLQGACNDVVRGDCGEKALGRGVSKADLALSLLNHLLDIGKILS